MRPSEREKMLAKARKVRERKQSTYDEVPSGRLTSRVQKAKDALDGRKGAKATSGTVLTFKDTGSGKGPDPKGLFKPRTTTQANRAKSQGGRSAAEVSANKKSKDPRGNQIKATPGKAKSATNYNVGVSKGGVSFGEAFKHFKSKGQSSFTWNGKKYTTEVAKAKPKAKVSTPTPADFTMTGKKAAPKKSAPKSKDPRTGFASKATPGKAKSALPAGAKPFTGSYNSKTHKLQNIKGKTYVVPKGK